MNDHREPLVLVAGLNNMPRIWEQVRCHLPKQVEVIAVDLPAIEDIDKLAAQVLFSLPARFALCGFSFGGYVALAILAASPERVARFALIASGSNADSPELASGREKARSMALAGKHADLVERQASFVVHASRADDQALKAYRREMVAEYGVDRFVAHQRAAIGRPDRTHLVRSFAGPLLIGCGADDRVIAAEKAAALAAGISGAQLRIFEQCGHLVPLEQPGALAEALSGWIAAPQPASSTRRA